MYIISINSYHSNLSACYLKDRKLISVIKTEKFLNFFENNRDFPKGSFQVKKRGESYYWYYTLSTSSSDRVKYLCKAENEESFDLAIKHLKEKIDKDISDLDSKIPEGPLEQKWTKYRSSLPLVSPANKKKLDIIIGVPQNLVEIQKN